MTSVPGQIAVLTTESSGRRDAFPIAPAATRSMAATVSMISAATLTENLSLTLKSLEDLPVEVPGGFSISEISLNFVVNAKGGFELIGKLEAGIEASVTVKLRRKGST